MLYGYDLIYSGAAITNPIVIPLAVEGDCTKNSGTTENLVFTIELGIGYDASAVTVGIVQCDRGVSARHN